MIEITVWLLISMSAYGSGGRGVATELGKFSSVKHCQQVQQNLPNKDSTESRCIQATILVPK